MKPATLSPIALSLAGVLLLSACSTSDPDAAPVTVTTTEQTSESATASASESSAAPVTDQCATSDLDIGILSQQGAAGSILLDVGFSNTGVSGCTLDGFPGVSLVGDNDGTQLGEAGVRENIESAAVVVEPGATAVSSIKITRAENYNDCGIVPADGLRVYPPGETHSVFLPVESLSACTAEGSELISIQPVTL